MISKALPEADARVVFHCNGFAVDSWVVWVRPPHAGIQFDEPIVPKELLRGVSLPPSLVRDTRELDFRRPGLRGNQLTAEERKALSEWQMSQAERPMAPKTKPRL